MGLPEALVSSSRPGLWSLASRMWMEVFLVLYVLSLWELSYCPWRSTLCPLGLGCPQPAFVLVTVVLEKGLHLLWAMFVVLSSSCLHGKYFTH